MNGLLVMAETTNALFHPNWVGWVSGSTGSCLGIPWAPHTHKEGQEKKRKKKKEKSLASDGKLKNLKKKKKKRSSLFSRNVLLDPLTLLLFITSLFLYSGWLSPVQHANVKELNLSVTRPYNPLIFDSPSPVLPPPSMISSASLWYSNTKALGKNGTNNSIEECLNIFALKHSKEVSMATA